MTGHTIVRSTTCSCIVVDTQTYLDCNVQCCSLLSIEQIHVDITVHQQCRQILLFLAMMLELPLDY